MTTNAGAGNVEAGRAAYRVHVRHDEFTFEHVVHATQVDREDGWTVFWDDNDVFMRMRDKHIVSLELLV